MKNYLSPIRILLYYLIALMLIGSLSQAGVSLSGWLIQIRNFVLLFGGGYGVYRLLLLSKKILPTRIEHRLITCSILFLLFYLDSPWYLFLGLGIAAELLQRFIRVPTGPLMNPAGLVTLIAALVLHFYPVWWGASFSPRIPVISGGVSIAVLFTLPFGIYVAYKYKKLKIVLALLIAFVLSYLLIVQNNPLFIVAEGTFAFFALIMVVEPKTSPVMQNEQLMYGAVLGILVSLAIKIGFAEPYTGPLIVCNLIFNLYRNRKFLLAKLHPAPVSPAVVSNVTISS